MRRLPALAVIALHALLLLLLAWSFRTPVGEEPDQPQFVSVWITPPVREPEPPAPSSPQRKTTVATRQPAPAPAQPITAPAPTISPPESTAIAPPLAVPPVDWAHEATVVARNASASSGRRNETFSPPPKVLGKACKPKESSMEWNGQSDRRVTMAGVVPIFRLNRRCVLALIMPFCVLGSLPEANNHLLNDMGQQDPTRSSVPDPDHCD